ncbi:CdiI family contact-dependent growth inhibition immunity protein [Pelistega sp. NLN82]|uniref:CdiI family contact-dependent growth inhibition immunity protein n=1 Tax=Pelistega ratti TaxID=2652177 RepID=A0A6L9Y8B5_9BURK|nr:contact-dependent growth inhibition system immunity protein [Pelistega ratti]NEN76629.1 CdiI family contact-dependent growth inhibition immunity protein [Pelistega ratti]
MKKSQMIQIQKTKEFILITSYLRGGLYATNPEQEFIYHPIDISDEELGAYIKQKLAESREISHEQLYELYQSNVIKELTNTLEKEMMLLYGYKNRKAIYKNMRFMSIESDKDKIIIMPEHQDSLNGATAISNEDNTMLSFIYDKTISDKDLGIAVREVFNYCTSIYW